MGTMAFQINDQSTDGSAFPAVWVTVNENPDSTFLFEARVDGAVIGDLRGLFFNVADESLIGALRVTHASPGFSQFRQANDIAANLGAGVAMNGLLGSDDGYDTDTVIGTAGIGKDDIQQFSFTLGTSRALSLNDFTNIDFGVCLTSVGRIGGMRCLSTKLLETAFRPIDAVSDSAAGAENGIANGNVLINDVAGIAEADTVAVTGWCGGALGQAFVLADAAGATLQLNVDGTYVLDSTGALALSEGEAPSFTFAHDARNMNETTSWATDAGSFTLMVSGANDGPNAQSDAMGRVREGGQVQGNVLGNDTDIEGLDMLNVIAVNGRTPENGMAVVTLDSGTSLTLYADGSYVYQSDDAFNALKDEQSAQDFFHYTISDGHGGTAGATASVAIDGSGSTTPTPSPDDQPVHYEGLSHGYWKNHEVDWDIAGTTMFEQFFGIDPGDWLVKENGNAVVHGDLAFIDAIALKNGQTLPATHAFARDAVAAMLNALDEDISYRYSVDEIKAMVQQAYVGGDIEGTKDLLEYNNTLHQWDLASVQYVFDPVTLVGQGRDEVLSGVTPV